MKKLISHNPAKVATMAMYLIGLLALPFVADAQLTVDVTQISGVATDTDIAVTIVRVITWIIGIAGAVAVAMLVYGGFRYITSAGNEDQLELAKTVITYSIVGIIIVLIAYVITVTVSNFITKTS